jgi:primosomal protein N' (replication factor Y)
LPKDANLVKACKQFVAEQVALLHADKKFRSVVVIPDVDP